MCKLAKVTVHRRSLEKKNVAYNSMFHIDNFFFFIRMKTLFCTTKKMKTLPIREKFMGKSLMENQNKYIMVFLQGKKKCISRSLVNISTVDFELHL